MKKIILIGHSHTNCLYTTFSDSYKEAYIVHRIHMLEIANNLKKLPTHKRMSLSDCVVEKTSQIINNNFTQSGKWFNRNKSKINIILLLGGSYHHMLGLMKSNPPFDFVHPQFSDLELDDKAEIIPFNAMREILILDINEHEKIIKSISEKFSYNIIHLGFPPTVFNEKLMMSNIEPFFSEKYKKLELAHHNVRFKLWRLYSDMYADMCNKHGIPFIQVPETMIENGMFLKEVAYGDSMHANHIYAKSYIDLLDSKLV